MSEKVRVELAPLGVSLDLDPGASLESVLFPYGVEFPCGGAGKCRGCRVRVVSGSLAITKEMERAFTPAELAAGWRLACCAHIEGPLTLEIAQLSTPVMADDSSFSFEPAEGSVIAIDLGTTTIAVQLVDRRSGKVLALRTALNPQAVHGADVMSRIEFALNGGAAELASLIRAGLGKIISTLPQLDTVNKVMLAGNSVMHHLFSALDVTPLAQAPFHTPQGGEQIFRPGELGWALPDHVTVHFLPCLGGFVGSDILAGVLATGMSERAELSALIDLGTNGEIALGNSERILCASTAAGPAFEAGRIHMGMRAASGAIAHVAIREGRLECRVLGNDSPRGICGSGLVDAVAAGLDLGSILPGGRLANDACEFPLTPPVCITQSDIRELQVAKAAVAAGLRILADSWGAPLHDIQTLYLAGAFGNYVNMDSARRIGLLESERARIIASGNTSLRGLKMALLRPSAFENCLARIRSRVEHISLASDPNFQEIFIDCLALR